MDAGIAPEADQFTPKLGLKVAHAVLLVRLSCAAKVVQAVAVLSAPLENAPHQQLVRIISAVFSIYTALKPAKEE